MCSYACAHNKLQGASFSLALNSVSALPSVLWVAKFENRCQWIRSEWAALNSSSTTAGS